MSDGLSEILRALGRIEGKLGAIEASLKDHTERMNRIDEDIEDVRKDVKELETRGEKRNARLEAKVILLDKKQYGFFFAGGIVWAIGVALIRFGII